MNEAPKALAELDKVLDIQAANGNWNYDAYMHGMLNGMIMARSCITGEDPQFRAAPEEWLADRPSSPLTDAYLCDGGTDKATSDQTKEG